jgi:septum site-determining protein MinD
MSRIISFHSFRGGTGKSNSTANIAAIFAAEGPRVGIVDTDLQSPGIQTLFGLGASDIPRYLNDYLWDKCSISETAYAVTANWSTPDVYLSSHPRPVVGVLHLDNLRTY